jgi:CspA family cold shock protein
LKRLAAPTRLGSALPSAFSDSPGSGGFLFCRRSGGFWGSCHRLGRIDPLVEWFNPTKGYGFIQPAGGGGKDVFVHISAVERTGLSTLNEGQRIDYEIVSNRGKESAESLKVK